MRRYLKITPLTIGLTITLLVLFMVIGSPGLLEILELKLLDQRFENRGRKQPGPEIVIVAVDEKSQDLLGRWPWPRNILARLVDKLVQDGAATIGFDMVFSESGDTAHQQAIDLLEQGAQTTGLDSRQSSRLKQELLKRKTPDERFADSIHNAKNVVLGYFFHDNLKDVLHLTSDEIQKGLQQIFPARYSGVEIPPDVNLDFLLKAPAVEANLPLFSPAAVGFFNIIPDVDGIVRHYPLIIKSGKNFFPPLFLQVVANYLEEPELSFAVDEYGVKEIRVGEMKIPANSQGQFLINYYGPEKTFPHFSVSDVLQDKIAPGTFDSRIVLVGATGKGIFDMRPTPLQKVFSGVEINATVIDNILQDNFLRFPQWYWAFTYAMVILIGITLTFLLSRLQAVPGFLVMLLFLVSYYFLGQEMFNRGIWINLIYPAIQIVLVYTAITISNYFQETKQKRFINNAFGQYLSPTVIRRLIDDPSKLKLGGELKQMTAFFSDVAGFSSISEKLNPTQLVELLNEYLTAMCDILAQYEGTIDKFEGDAIIAFWGAPVDCPDHALRSCLASLDMQKKLAAMRVQWKKDNKAQLTVRIGLNTGNMVVGNMGSRNRMDYTMMGDSVNLASRLEGVNKVYGTEIMISQFTYEDVKDAIEVRELDKILVVGKKKPVAIYEILERKGRLDPVMQEVVKNFAEGLKWYREKRWEEALGSFHRALKIKPDDKPAQIFIRRCLEFKTTALPDEWDGVYQMISK